MHPAPREESLHIRTSQSEKALLARAAKAKHVNVSQFVLQTCLEAARSVVRDENAIWVDAEEYDWLSKKLEEPPKDLPELRQLLNESVTWNG